MARTLPLVVGLATLFHHTMAFTFNTSVPTQCQDFTVQWDGGTPPFHLVLVPAETVTGGRILNISIPETSSPYSHTFSLNQPAGLDFLATMYDAEGWGTGGTTPVLTVGSSDNSSCISSDLNYAFYFYTEPTTPPSQCQTMTVTWPNNVTLPVGLYGLIPGGSAFELPAPQSPSDTSYDWTVNVAQGTDVILLMADSSSAQTGGSTPLLQVGQGSTGCINDTSPSAGTGGTGSGTASGTGPSASVSGVGGISGGGSGGGSGQGNGGSDGGGGGSKAPIGAIVGGTVGGVAFIVLLAILLFFCLRRRSRERRDSSDSSLVKNYGMGNGGTEKRNRLDILAGASGSRRDGGLGRAGSDSEARANGAEYQPVPFRYPSPPPGSEGGRKSVPPTSFPVMAASKDADLRPSFESDNTTTTTRNGSTPMNTSIATGTGTGSQAGRTDDATVGHCNGVQRGASTRKTGVPGNPTVNTSSPRRGVDEMPSDDGARIVQHQDEGPVVDLPPRYDQLRTRNPDV